mgnify:FL=1|tara:strand:+ start:178 stop:696 length:519 start_codon:yes stop_codon:yes gene_type:complete
MTIEGEASLPPSSTTIVYANQKSGGPRVFGALAMLLGAFGVIFGLIGLIGAGDSAASLGADQTIYWPYFYLSPLIGVASSALFVYAGFLLWNYKKKGVWYGFGAVGVNAIDGILGSIIVGLVAEEVGDALGAEGLGGIAAGLGLAGTLVGAVCCGAIVALPLLMNGNDLDDD